MRKDAKTLSPAADKRKYIRLPKHFPVKFTIVRLHGDLLGIEWEHGTTRNISEGGICLETDRLSDPTVQYLSKEEIYLELYLQLPLDKEAVRIIGAVAWSHKNAQDPDRYTLGVEFRKIVAEDLKRLLRHTRKRRLFQRKR